MTRHIDWKREDTGTRAGAILYPNFQFQGYFLLDEP